ncbi:hypothetical protein EON65_38830 [archaeon]|nr:MAG: hypothetical protein EON65_38830 [archaeon]
MCCSVGEGDLTKFKSYIGHSNEAEQSQHQQSPYLPPTQANLTNHLTMQAQNSPATTSATTIRTTATSPSAPPTPTSTSTNPPTTNIASSSRRASVDNDPVLPSSSRRSIGSTRSHTSIAASSSGRSLSMVGRNNKFRKLIQTNEEVHMAGMAARSSFFVQNLFDIVLVINRSFDENQDGNDESTSNIMRLMLVDANSYKQAAEILWTSPKKGAKKKSSYPIVTMVDNTCFDVKDVQTGTTYRLYPKDKIPANEWVMVINSIPLPSEE